jgi:formate hydrogenlyase subunit 3/multisubunit Na+/H+ antiporter MnhD subunit
VVLGITVSPRAAFSYLVTSGVALIVLFVCAESFIRAQHNATLDKMDGLAARMPGTFYLFLLAVIWLAGLPPFGNFFSKYLLGTAAEEISPFLSYAITGTSILTLGYFLRPLRHFLTSPGKDARSVAP